MTRNETMANAMIQVLKSEGLSLECLQEKAPKGFWNKVSELYPTGQGYPTEKSALSNYFGKNKTPIMNILRSANREVSAFEPNKEQTELLSDAHSEPELQDSLKPTEKPIQASSYPTHEIHQLIEKVVQKRLQELKSGILNELRTDVPNERPYFDLVPEPETVKGSIGRKLTRQFVKTTLTIDKNLWLLFEQQAKSLKIDKSRLLDSILWLHFDKPTLTYGNE